MQTKLEKNKNVKDPRALRSEDFYDSNPSGIVKVHKTTRAGATVALRALYIIEQGD